MSDGTGAQVLTVKWSADVPYCPRCMAAIADRGEHWECVWCGFTTDIDVIDQHLFRFRLRHHPELRPLLDIQAPGWSVISGDTIRIRTTQWCHIDVEAAVLIVTIRESRLSGDGAHARSWDYSGESSTQSLRDAIEAASRWDGSPGSEPGGWVREQRSMRRRPDGDPAREYVAP